MNRYRLLAHLLAYPSAELHAALPEIARDIAADAAIQAAVRRDLAASLAGFAKTALLDWQEQYIATFDRIRSLSLHLFEHVHGDSRERGPAMLDLIALYRRHGMDATSTELPDYLPLFLEFLSTLDAAEAATLLAEAGAVLQSLHGRLEKRGSAYAAPFALLLQLAGLLARETDEAPEQLDLAVLDRIWEEAAVAFGPENNPTTQSGCDRAATMVARMQQSPGA